MIQTIDSHQHFWRYSATEYDWIDDSMRVLRRDFLPAELKTEMEQSGVDAVISVQARQTTAETEWLLSLATGHPWIVGVVGWAPLADSHLEVWLQQWGSHPKLKALRHVLQAEPDPRFMLGAAFQNGIRLLTRFNLAYDLLIYERQLAPAIELVSAHPDQRFILDHCAKPRIGEGVMEPWRTHLKELARRENVVCKLSGLITEAQWSTWTYETLRPYLDEALASFGPKRLMLGSDWPVCTVAGTYIAWWETLQRWMEPLTREERLQLRRNTAANAYRIVLDPPA